MEASREPGGGLDRALNNPGEKTPVFPAEGFAACRVNSKSAAGGVFLPRTDKNDFNFSRMRMRAARGFLT